MKGIDVSSYQGTIDWAKVKKEGYKFAIIFDVSKDEWEDPEKETPIYFMDELLDELIRYCGTEKVKKELAKLEEVR